MCVCGGSKGHEGLFPVPSTQGTAADEDAVERCSEGAQFAEEESRCPDSEVQADPGQDH